MHFIVIPCETLYNGILRRSILVALDVVAYLTYLKMKYHNNLGKLGVILADLREDCLIHETMLKNTLKIIVASERRMKKICQVISMVDLDVRENEIL